MYVFIGIISFFTLISFVVMNTPQFGKTPDGARLERVRSSTNYKDGQFQNQSFTPTLTVEKNRFLVMASFMFKKKVRTTPVDEIPSIKTDLTSKNGDFLVWFGHSSYFIRIDGKTFLVDPVLSGHASPFSWSVKAFNGTNIFSPDDIPEIDYLIITHDHWDHLDYETIIDLKPRIRNIITGLGTGAHLEHWGINPQIIHEFDWYEHFSLESGFSVTSTPARHFSGRSLKRNKTLWTSFVLKTPSMKIFIGGDGGYDKHFAEIGEKYGPFDLAILEQGQYDQRWKYIHLLPSEVFQAAEDLKAKRLFAVHNSKFVLGAHPWDEPLIRLAENSKNSKVKAITPVIGEKVDLKDTNQEFKRWWVGMQ